MILFVSFQVQSLKAVLSGFAQKIGLQLRIKT